MVAVLTHFFGPGNIDLAEDVVQDAIVDAIRYWQYKGVPDDLSAWLYKVARNKALTALNREKYKRKYSTETAHFLKAEENNQSPLEHLFSDQEISDDQLRMLFTCCHPSISTDSQVALALKTLCGFSIPEIAKAFLTTEENINKRLVRARQTIRDANIPFDIPMGRDLESRLPTVLETIYLLFNEGYSASTGDGVIRHDLCDEAIRLAKMIAGHNAIRDKDNVHALLALMLLNASRFNARQDKEGNLLSMAEQDRSAWDRNMRNNGLSYLSEAIKNEGHSLYHILAAISAQHCLAENYASTDWESILSLYNKLREIDDSPVVLLNRAIALSNVEGAEKGLLELEQIKDNPFLQSYYLYYSIKAELLKQVNRLAEAESSFQKAIELAPLQAEKDSLHKKLVSMQKK